jgi:ribosomal protein S18 acetylase RimI-like enzyme
MHEKQDVIGLSTEVRALAADEMDHAIAAIVAAFLTDPAARFAWPGARDYLQSMPLAIREFAGASFQRGTALVSADLRGAALWLPPGAEPDSETLEKVFGDTANRENLADLLATFEKMEQAHPKEAHWYLAMIGVEPNAQGRGLGAQLMHHGVTRCDQAGELAYLETSNPRNIALYRRFGFEVLDEFQIGSAPLVTSMLRRPR